MARWKLGRCRNDARPDAALAARLQATCPSLWADQGGAEGRYCCTPEQVDKIATDTQKAGPFIVGCPACQHNFVHVWCVLACSPDQATFTNVSAVQKAADNGATVVKEVDVWTSDAFKTAFFDSCKVCWLVFCFLFSVCCVALSVSERYQEQHTQNTTHKT